MSEEKLELIRQLVEATGFICGCWGDRCTGWCDQCRGADFYHTVARIVEADAYGRGDGEWLNALHRALAGGDEEET